MIMDSKTPHKVPAISTSEDSQDARKSSTLASKKTSIPSKKMTANDKDENRDMGETRRVAHKPTMDRDSMDLSYHDKNVPCSVATAALSLKSKENQVNARTTNDTDVRMQAANDPSKESSVLKDSLHVTKEASHHSLLPSSSASFDHIMDGQPWTHSLNVSDGGASVPSAKEMSKPKHRRSPAAMFPLPSPKSNHQPECGDDEASFHLFNHSFDTTMSDAAAYLHELHPAEPSLPALGQYTGGDVSPIRVHFPQEEVSTTADRGGYFGQLEGIQTNFYGGNLVSNPIFVLRCAHKAFSNCTFLFSRVRESEPCAVNVSENGAFQHYEGSDNQAYHEPWDARDLSIATRRVGAAICAFGGTIKPEQPSRMTASIFRPKGGTSHESINEGKLVNNQAYEERLRNRYFLRSNHVSWEMEENPPIESSDVNGTRNTILAHMNTSSGSYAPKDGKTSSETSSTQSLSSHPYSSIVEMTSNGTDPPKMKYRCKLCGQPKQNHNCPYRQSMQRSIGITVRPAVNSFTAHEPGALTMALSEMNNFISDDSDHGSFPPLSTAPDLSGTKKHRRSNATVTPDTFRSGALLPTQSSQSSRESPGDLSHQEELQMEEEKSDAKGHVSRKRTHSEMEDEVNHDPSVPFFEEISLRPEQYRAVTFPKDPETVGAYQYPAVPLTPMERQKLSDTLFVLSREIPNLTEECSSLLIEARMKNMWDLAVAELLTQLIVALYCQEGDRCLDGLQNYLLYLGVSC